MTRQKRSALVVAIAAFCCGVVLVGVGLAKTMSRPPVPWAAEALPLVQFIEATRGKAFKRSVPVLFLSPADFDAEVIAPRNHRGSRWSDVQFGETSVWMCSNTNAAYGPCNDSFGREIDPQSRTKRLLGLESLETPTAVYFAELRGGDIVGVYQSDQRRILVRGSYTPLIAPTLIHELNHAWQDQHFALNELNYDRGSDGVAAARSLFEGDSMRIEHLYLDSLPAVAQAELESAIEQESADWDAAELAADPGAFDEQDGDPISMRAQEIDYLTFPYDEGTSFVYNVATAHQEQGVQDALQHPPRRTAEILHSDRYLARLKHGEDPATRHRLLQRELGLATTRTFHPESKTLGEQMNRLILTSISESESEASTLAGSIRTDGYTVYWNADRLCIDLGWAADRDTVGATAIVELSRWATGRGGVPIADRPIGQGARGLTVRFCEG